MTLETLIPLVLALVPYAVTHAIIIALLLRLRRRLPPEHRKVSRWWLWGTVAPLVGPIVSSVALAKLAKCIQSATVGNPAVRGDCGHAAGIAYGLLYLIAAWAKSPALGALALALLVLFFWLATAALRIARRQNTSPELLRATV